MGHFNMLPHDIMLEIFSRVPIESVLECKLVSKPWRNLLQHPSFYQMHMNHPNQLDSGKLSFIFCTLSDENPYYYREYDENLNCFSRTITLKLGSPIRNYCIQASCNGLICINGYLDGCYVQPAYICNPITGEYIILPKFEENPLSIGFGYSPSTNKYKVVRIRRYWRDPDCGILQVYTLGSGMGWRDIRKVDYNESIYNRRCTFADGAIHWMGANGTIVAFDLADEEFRELPALPSLPCSRCSITELGDFLCSYCFHAGSFGIWILKKNESNHVIWSKEFSSNLNMTVKPIYFTKRDELLLYNYEDKNVYRYTKKDPSPGMLVNFGKYLNDVVPHKNTVVSLKALGEQDSKLMYGGENKAVGFGEQDTKLLDVGETVRSSGENKAVGVKRRNRRKKKNH